MPKRKSKKIFQYLFLFLIIGTLNNKNLSTFELPKIDEISVSGLSEKENLELLKSLEKFKKNNLFFLSKFELVKIIEKNDYIGGHTHTHEIENDNKTWNVDSGFIVFNEINYPNLCNLFEELNVKSYESDMSFAVSNKIDNIEYSGTNLSSLFSESLYSIL